MEDWRLNAFANESDSFELFLWGIPASLPLVVHVTQETICPETCARERDPSPLLGNPTLVISFPREGDRGVPGHEETHLVMGGLVVSKKHAGIIVHFPAPRSDAPSNMHTPPPPPISSGRGKIFGVCCGPKRLRIVIHPAGEVGKNTCQLIWG